DALWSSALWDKRMRELSAALAITDANDYGEPTAAILYRRDATIVLAKIGGAWAAQDRQQHNLGRTLCEALPNDPQLSRPLGRSRITREVRYLTDAALRTMIRAEVASEFFSAPQRYALGAKEDAFADHTRWSIVMGRMLAL